MRTARCFGCVEVLVTVAALTLGELGCASNVIGSGEELGNGQGGEGGPLDSGNAGTGTATGQNTGNGGEGDGGSNGDPEGGGSAVGGNAAGGGGDGGDSSTETDPEEDPLSVTFSCTEPESPAEAPLVRLSMRQYANTLRDLFDAYGQVAAVDAASDLIAQFPIDGEAEDAFKQMDHRVAQRHIDNYFGVADAISNYIVADPGRLAAVAGDCATEAAVDAACFAAFVDEFAARAFRRPLSEDEVARLAELDDPAETSAEVYRGVIFTALMAPPFLYHFEVDGPALEADDSVSELSAYELAARLSYHFWQSMPDAELTAAAADGSLLTTDGYQAAVERLFSSPRTEETVRSFFSDWYRLDVFGGFATTPAFETFRGTVDASAELYTDAVEEIHALVRYELENGGNYTDVLQSNLNVATSERLAEVYGVEPWDGTSAPGTLPEGERAGVLTRAGMLISSNHGTNPFRRGAFIRRSVLCIDVQIPGNLPADALTPPEFDAMASTRERFEAKVADATCSGCHSTFTPYGMALESYDGLGRYRTEEQLIADDGELIGSVPINSGVDALFEEVTPLEGPLELSQAIAGSRLSGECFARHYFRYTYRRNEQPGDECTLASTLDRLGEAGSLAETLKDIAIDPAFRLRKVGE